MNNTFFRFSFTSNLLYIGERIKKGTFKPALTPIAARYGKKKSSGKEILPLPCSTIIGAVEAILGERKRVYGIGKLIKSERGYLNVAPYDTALGAAKLPITIEYLTGVQGVFYIKKTEDFPSMELIGDEIDLGGLKSKGFGKCNITSRAEIEPKRLNGKGLLLSRVYYEEDFLKHFGISMENILKPYFGYLFKKTSQFDGYYQKSIFENTVLTNGYDFLTEVIK